LANGVQQVENRVSGTEDKVEQLDHTVKDPERILRKYKWNMQAIWDTMKRPNLQIMGVEKGEEIQTKGNDNLFNRIIAENFPKLEKERIIQIQEAYRTSNHQDQKKKYPQTHHNQNTNHTEQRKNSESYKTEKTRHLKRQTH
jgi:hypothetical protein